jgi:DNA-3-methyladenine glycosylase
MTIRRLERGFFARDTLAVARELLGQRLVRILDGERLSGRIVEVEAYIGEDDEACHARSGRTERNAAMYGPPGHAYVYFIYGVHHCLNVVTEQEGFPAAVLVRALEPLEGIGAMCESRWPGSVEDRGGQPDIELASGPAKLCRALAIDRRFDGADLCVPDTPLFIERDADVPEEKVAAGPRVGVRGDEEALSIPWRFCIGDSWYVSR